MAPFLPLSRFIDAISIGLGKFVMWLILAATAISAGNAVMRKAFNVGSNAYLEIQWYLFAAVFMLGVGYVMLKNAHVRIDFVATHLSKRANATIDAIGIVMFTIPLAIIMVNLGWPIFARAFMSGEMSQNSGGLIRWPVVMLVPLGFALLIMQAISELIKRLAFLTGDLAEPFSLEHEKSAEEMLAEELAAEAEARLSAQPVGGR